MDEVSVGSTWPLLALAFASWLVLELVLDVRDRGMAKGGDSDADAGTRSRTFGAIAAGVVGAGVVALAWAPAGTIASRADIATAVGATLLAAGVVLRTWAVASLGRFFRLSVTLHQGQRVVTAGPYRLIRHPSYTGLLLVAVGLGLGLNHWLSLAAAVVPSFVALLVRIRVEEAALATALGVEYSSYAARTKRLVPGIW